MKNSHKSAILAPVIRVFRVGPIGAIFMFILLIGLFLSFPIIIATFLILMSARSLLVAWKRTQEQRQIDPTISKTLKSEKIGEYKIKQNPHDPTIIEVL
ncbi:MAG: hypothetical protein KA116_08395 [Proteobacteria bacterium]|nr:hypothetical protein [Pseudomonadota bacterium]